MAKATSLHELSITVRLPETDSFGVVYYSNYFVYFDLARMELLRSLGITQDYLKRHGLQFYAAHASCKYHSSAHFDETIKIRSWLSDIGRKSVTYRHKILRAGNNQLLVEGHVTDVLVNEKQKPMQLPDDLTQKLGGALILGEG